ncbi:MAG: hypothetical protein M0Z66_14055 [Thermaerobacter sp.]|nr:hypothetical protein [Thermaerobacter sp.]
MASFLAEPANTTLVIAALTALVATITLVVSLVYSRRMDKKLLSLNTLIGSLQTSTTRMLAATQNLTSVTTINSLTEAMQTLLRLKNATQMLAHTCDVFLSRGDVESWEEVKAQCRVYPLDLHRSVVDLPLFKEPDLDTLGSFVGALGAVAKASNDASRRREAARRVIELAPEVKNVAQGGIVAAGNVTARLQSLIRDSVFTQDMEP